MKRCNSCNTLNEDYATVCFRCGRKLDAKAGGAPGAPRPNVQPGGVGVQNGGYMYTSPFDHTREFSPEAISKGKPLAMAVYLLGTIGLIIGLFNHDSEYVKFHVRQCVKYLILNSLVASCLVILTLFFVGTGALAGSLGMMKAGTVFLAIYLIYRMVIGILMFIDFLWVGQGKAIEALLVRNLQFMK